MDKKASIYVAGHQGLVGSSLIRKLKIEGFSNIISISQQGLDLRNQAAVDHFFAEFRPEYVFLAAARVGGIAANSAYPADYIRDNLLIQTNIIDAAYRYQVQKLLFLGSSCIYPKLSPQPIKEEYLLEGQLEPSNEAYAIAKIAGLKMCQAYNRQYGANFITVMPTNLYGPNDNFELESSHVLPALIHKFHQARVNREDLVVVWGSGAPRREFLHVDDLAAACLYLMQHYSNSEIINIGSGQDISIAHLAELVKSVVGYTGNIIFDTTKPDGTPRKLLDTGKINSLGWRPRIGLEDGIRSTYEWFSQNVCVTRGRFSCHPRKTQKR